MGIGCSSGGRGVVRGGPITIRGRETELARVEEALASARAGRSAVLVVRGAVGIGKSRLLEAAAVSAPDDVLVLRAHGTEAEWDLPYAGLSALCRPLLPFLDELSERSRDSLRTALALSGHDGMAPHVLGVALLELLASAAERFPVLMVVDDYSWLDPSSRRAVAFALRRLGAERVCALVGDGGSPEDDRGDLDRLPRLDLAPLDDAAAKALLRDLAPSVARAVADAVVATAGGSPLALTAIAHFLRPAQLDGTEPLPSPLPFPAGAEGVVGARLRDLPEPVRLALAVAAAEQSGDLAVVRRALEALPADPQALHLAEGQQLLAVGGGRVGFPSPLLRSAAYSLLDAASRRNVHRALAGALPAEDVDRRAWHLAAAASDLDDEVADLLLEAGSRARSRGAPDEAARAFVRAAELARDPQRRTAGLLAAAQQALSAGNVEQARALADEVGATATDLPTRAEACIVLARTASLVGDPTTAYHGVTALLPDVATHLPALAARLCTEAVALAFKAATLEALPLAHRAVELAAAADDAATRLRAKLALAVARSLHGEQQPPGELLGLVEAVLREGVPVGEVAVLLSEAALGLHATGRSDEGLALIEAVARAARSARAVDVLAQALIARANLENSLNRYTDAWVSTAEAAQLAEDLGQHAVRRDLALRLGALEALRGSFDQARKHYQDVLAHGSHDFLWLRARRGLGVLELGAGQPEAAAHHLEQLDELARAVGRTDLSHGIYEHDLNLAYVELGRLREAAELTERFAVLAEASALPTAKAALAYMRAVLAPDPEVEQAFSHAVEVARPQPFLHVRVLAAWAERLGRLGHADAARARLRSARELAHTIGAPAVAQWVDRAGAVVPTSETPALARPPSSLAAPERQVATAVVAGSSVAQAATDLMVSEGTAGQLLQRALVATRATSLAELAERLPPGEAAPAPEPVDGAERTVLALLGRCEVTSGGTALPAPDGVPGRALRIVALRRQLHVEELAELLWPESDPQAGRMRLRNVVSRLRSAVGPVLERHGELVVLAPDVEVDVDRFEQLARAAHAAFDAGDLPTATETAHRAAALYLGPLLPDSPYADWTLAPRERYQRLYVAMLDLLAEAAVRRGESDAALALLERAAEVEPYEEERFLRAAEICLAAGRRGAAAAMLERARRVTERLGVPPDPRHDDLSARLRR